MTVKLERVHPVLMSSNIGASVVFYRRLGFHQSFVDNAGDPRYAGIRRDDVELHLQWADATQWAYPNDRPVYRFVVGDPDALHLEFVQSGALSVDAPGAGPWAQPGSTPWATREFHVRDPDGNGLQFYRPL